MSFLAKHLHSVLKFLMLMTSINCLEDNMFRLFLFSGFVLPERATSVGEGGGQRDSNVMQLPYVLGFQIDGSMDSSPLRFPLLAYLSPWSTTLPLLIIYNLSREPLISVTTAP